jgi:hypothetical protein
VTTGWEVKPVYRCSVPIHGKDAIYLSRKPSPSILHKRFHLHKAIKKYTYIYIYIRVAQQPYSGPGRLIVDVSTSHTDTPHWAGLLWTRDRLVAETSTPNHTTFTRDRHHAPVEFEPAIPASQQPQTYD